MREQITKQTKQLVSSSTKAPKRATQNREDPVIKVKDLKTNLYEKVTNSGPSRSSRSSLTGAPVAYSQSAINKSRKEHFVMKTKDMSENVVAKGHCLLACATFQDIAPSPLYARGLIPWNILYRFPIHPKTIGSGRLKAISTLFQNYKFTKLRIEYIPETNSLSNGDVAVWFSQNMDTVYPTEDGFALRSYLEECEDASGCHVWDPMITDPLKEKSTHDVYFTERTSMDLTQIYQTSVAIATSYTDTATKYLGDFVLHYEIELSAPRAPADLFERNSVAGLQFIVTPLTIGMPCIFHHWT